MFTTEFTTKRVVFQCVRAMRKRSLLQQNLQQRLQQNLGCLQQNDARCLQQNLQQNVLCFNVLERCENAAFYNRIYNSVYNRI